MTELRLSEPSDQATTSVGHMWRASPPCGCQPHLSGAHFLGDVPGALSLGVLWRMALLAGAAQP